MAEFGEPTFYRYYEHQILPAAVFGVHTDLYLLVFGPDTDSLADPNIEPVGVYHHAGIRKYLWREAYWSETDWDRREVQKRIQNLMRYPTTPASPLMAAAETERLQHLLKLVQMASTYGAPSPTDGRPPLQDPISSAVKSFFKIPIDELIMSKNKRKRYCRAICRIND